MAETRLRYRQGLMLGTALVALTACSGPIDLDLRSYGNGFDTSDAALAASADRPSPDNRGVISYPTYQVAVARRGDTVAALADRVGVSGDELAHYNGLKTGDLLRPGEVLALPRRVAEPSAATGAPIDGPLRPGSIDVSTIDAAIDRGASGRPAPAPAAAPATAEPIRHKVVRGETAYSVARLYNVSVRALSDWNGLGPDLTIREGQYLLIPVAAGKPPATAAVEAPGTGSVSPEPPSAAKPLPDEQLAAVPANQPPSPDLGKQTASKSRLQMPVQGKIIREYVKKKNEGIDISAGAGAQVVSAGDGTVAAITRDTDQVPILVIRHADNILTVYAGLDAISVKKGDKVKRGQGIGKVRAGSPSFVHFEVRDGFESTDPVPYLN